MSDAEVRPISFHDCLKACVSNREYVANWERLRGVRIARTPIETMIDRATGNDEAIMAQFALDVFDTVYSRLVAETPLP